MVKHLRLLIAVSILVALFDGCAQQLQRTPQLSVPPATAPDNVVYIVEGGGRIRAVDQNGKDRWSFSVAEALPTANNRSSSEFQIAFIVARTEGHLFGLASQLSGARAGQTYLFALAGDHLVWQKEVVPPTSMMPPIAADANAVYEATNNGVIYAFSQIDGRLLWQQRVSEGPIGSLTIGSDGTIYAIGPLGHLHALASDGSEKWKIETH